MDERYRKAYAQLYAARTRPDRTEQYEQLLALLRDSRWFEHATGFIAETIELAEQELPEGRLREDAKALIAINFYDLVLVPLRLGNRLSDEELEERIRADIRLLVQAAARDQVESSRDGEISGHRVISSLNRLWESLSITNLRLWE
jgi:hypothetical protein